MSQRTWIWPVRTVSVLLAGTVLAVGTGSVIGFFFIHVRTGTSVIVQKVNRVEVKEGNGDVVIRSGAVGSPIVVTATLHSALRTARYTQSVTGGVLRAVGSCRSWSIFADSCSADLTLTVPPGLSVVVTIDNGDSTVRTTGPITVTSQNGDIDVTRGGGSIQVRTSNGDVTGSRLLAGTVSAKSSTGDVDLTFAVPPGHVTATSGVGDVEVAVPDDGTAYRVDATAIIGDRSVSVPTAGTARTITAHSATGDVRIRTTKPTTP